MDAMTELPVSPFSISTAMCTDNKDISPLHYSSQMRIYPAKV